MSHAQTGTQTNQLAPERTTTADCRESPPLTLYRMGVAPMGVGASSCDARCFRCVCEPRLRAVVGRPKTSRSVPAPAEAEAEAEAGSSPCDMDTADSAEDAIRGEESVLDGRATFVGGVKGASTRSAASAPADFAPADAPLSAWLWSWPWPGAGPELARRCCEAEGAGLNTTAGCNIGTRPSSPLAPPPSCSTGCSADRGRGRGDEKSGAAGGAGRRRLLAVLPRPPPPTERKGARAAAAVVARLIPLLWLARFVRVVRARGVRRGVDAAAVAGVWK